MKLLRLNVIALLLFISCKNDKKEVADIAVDKPMNILFIAVDDLRPELKFYGANHIKSPNLDKLAGESLVFNRAYCNIPVCGASRASLLTGTRPTRHRFIGAFTEKDHDYPEAISLPMLFKQNGYKTISNGKIYHHLKDDSLAWDNIWFPDGNIRDYQLEQNKLITEKPGYGYPVENVDVNDGAYFDGRIANKGIEDLKKLKNSDEPFFLALGFMKPQKGHLSDDFAKELIHGYYACVSYLDAQIGKVLQELEDLGLAESTTVILWGDHGWNLGDHQLWCKHSTFETALKTPLLIKVPGKTKGTKTEAITEYIDIYPSLVELVGLEAPKTIEGKSLLPIINGEKSNKNWAVSKFKDAVTLIKGDLFYTEWTDDEGVAYARMLFDHKTDPLELDNLAEKPEYQETVKELALELRAKWGKDFLVNTVTVKTKH